MIAVRATSLVRMILFANCRHDANPRVGCLGCLVLMLPAVVFSVPLSCQAQPVGHGDRHTFEHELPAWYTGAGEPEMDCASLSTSAEPDRENQTMPWQPIDQLAAIEAKLGTATTEFTYSPKHFFFRIGLAGAGVLFGFFLLFVALIV